MEKRAVQWHLDLRLGVLGCCVAVIACGGVTVAWAGQPQSSPVEAKYETCARLVKKDVKALTNDELRLLGACLKPVKQRLEEKERPSASIPEIQQTAPIRIYGTERR
jgi:hypothetical protein